MYLLVYVYISIFMVLFICISMHIYLYTYVYIHEHIFNYLYTYLSMSFWLVSLSAFALLPKKENTKSDPIKINLTMQVSSKLPLFELKQNEWLRDKIRSFLLGLLLCRLRKMKIFSSFKAIDLKCS